jgi:cell division initiation protein
MLTPVEIENKEFKKGLRGYKEEEVDEFLDAVKEDFETLYKENVDLKEKIRLYEIEIDKYSNIEETIKDTLVTAQGAAKDTTEAAHKKAKIIVEEANLRARQSVSDANNRVITIRKEYDELVKEFKIFRNKFKSLIEDEIRSIDEIFYDVDESCKEPFETLALYDVEDAEVVEVATILE